MTHRDADENGWEEDEWDGDAQDGPDEEEEPTRKCPYCKREIHEDSQRCPYCEQYISEEDAPPARKPWWIIIGALLALYVVYRWIVG